MRDISEIDANFRVVTGAEDGIVFYDADAAPFRVYGLLRQDDRYCRMPVALAQSVSEKLAQLNYHTAGGRVRFVTDSATVAIRAEMFDPYKTSHFALTGSVGFDLYADEGEGDRHAHTYVPPFTLQEGYTASHHFNERKRRVITVNFPLYCGVKRLLLGIEEEALLEEAPDYQVEKPVVFYGSSITQGGCASRPGTCYESIISRVLNCHYTNLGFSGNAKAEREIADYIAGLDMSAFVYDYDYNAPDAAYLAATHQRMFRIIREKNPCLPIIIMSAPNAHLPGDLPARLAVIRRTYEEAVAAGDKNVYLLEGAKMISERNAEIWSVDNCHPNDNGFADMAYAVAEVLKGLL